MSTNTLDISNINNDFIYQMIRYYLEKTSNNEEKINIHDSVNNLVDTITTYYFVGKKSGVFDINKARQILKNKFSELDAKIIDQYIEKVQNEDVDIGEKKSSTNPFDQTLNLLEDILKSNDLFIKNVGETIREQYTEIQNQTEYFNKLRNELNTNTDIVVVPVNTYKDTLVDRKAAEPIILKSQQKNIDNMSDKPIYHVEPVEKKSVDVILEPTIIPESSKIALRKSLEKLYSRLNTPVINIIIGFILYKIFMIIFF